MLELPSEPPMAQYCQAELIRDGQAGRRVMGPGTGVGSWGSVLVGSPLQFRVWLWGRDRGGQRDPGGCGGGLLGTLRASAHTHGDGRERGAGRAQFLFGSEGFAPSSKAVP